MKQKLIVLMAAMMAVATSAWADAKLVETITYTDGIVYNLYQDGETRYAEVGANSTAAGASENYSCADLVIPSSVTYEDVTYNVTAIAANAFNYCDGLTGSLTIPEGVTSISDKAFYYCYMLTSLSLPDGLTTIGEQAFRNCNGLGSITIPGSVASMGKGAFNECSSAKTLTIEPGLTTIPEEAFGYCYALQTITIPNTVTTIGNQAFKNDNNFQEITIPDGVTSIGQSAFSGCSQLQSITIPNSVESIGNYAFYRCYGLKSVKLPENPNYTSLSYEMFMECSGLTTFTIPSQITSIGGEAFNKCSNLKRLYVPTPIVPTAQAYAIPSSVVIYVRKNLMSEFEKATNWSGHTFSAFQNYIKYYTDENAAIAIDETANFGTGVAFQANFIDGKEGEKYVGYIDFSEKPTEIPANLFKDKTALTGIVIPSGIETIGADAFSGCANLSSMTFFTSSKPAIDASAFSGTTSLSEVYLREVAKSGFETDAFWSGKTLKTFKNIKYKTNDGKALDFASLTGYGDDIQFIGDFYDEEVGGYIEYLGDVTTIPASAFVNRTNLTELTIPDGVTTIGSSAFSGCSALTAMELPEGLEKINSGLFNDCSSLKEVTIPSTVTECNASSTFDGCSNLEAAYMLTPKAPTIVWASGSLFYNKPKLVVYVRSAARSSYGTGESWEYGKLGIIKEIKYFTEDEKAVTPSKTTGFGDEVRYIASFYEVDKNENKWGSMLFTKDPTEIPDGAFENCDKLTEVRIPESVETFGDGVFAGCGKLKSVILLSTSGATITTSSFTNTASTDMKVYVRKSALDSYSSLGDLVKVLPYIKYTTSTKAAIDRHDWSKLIQYWPADLEYGESYLVGTQEGDDYVGYMDFLSVPTEIPQYLFYEKTDLKSVTIPAEITKVSPSAFEGCKNLAKVTFEEGSLLKEIGKKAFSECNALTDFKMPNSVETIGADAFYDNRSITKIHIPTNLKSIGADAFDKKSNITYENVTEVTYDGTLEQWCAIDFADRESYPMYRANGNCTIKRSNGDDFFGTELTIPTSVTEIKPYAFYKANITSLNLGNVTKVGKSAFYDCSALTSLINEDKLTEIGESAFSSAKITTLNLGSVTTLGKSAFNYCSSLTSLTLSDQLTEISEYAFYYTKITSLDLKNVTKIGEDAFHGCSSLATLTMNKVLEEMGDEAFKYTNIKTLNYNIENAATLANKPYDATKLTTVNIGEDVKAIPADAFDGCTSLTSASYGGDLEGWCGITFGNEKANPMNFFTAGTANIKDSSDQPLFPAELVIPSTVTEVKAHAFINANIQKLKIPADVTSIANTAFTGCTALTEITAQHTNPLTITDSTFASTVTKANVPVAGYIAYKSADFWKGLTLTPMAGEITLADNGTSAYEIDQTVADCDITYTRTFKNDSWQALFVPFAMTYDDWKEHGKVAELVSVDEDGTLVWEIVEDKEEPVDPSDPNGETQTVKGKTVAGKPYIFKPNKFEDGQTQETVTFSVSHATLAKNTETTDVEPKYTDSDTQSDFVLSGTYKTKDDMENVYALAGGNFYKGTANSPALSPYRIFLSIPSQSSDPSASGSSPAQIRSRVNGEGVTSIDDIEVEYEAPIYEAPHTYNIFGQPVGEDYKGIVIVNGKKVMRK